MLHNEYVCASFKGGTAREKSGKAHLSGHSHRFYAAKLKVFQRIGSKAGDFFSTPVLYASVLKHTQAHPNKKSTQPAVEKREKFRAQRLTVVTTCLKLVDRASAGA